MGVEGESARGLKMKRARADDCALGTSADQAGDGLLGDVLGIGRRRELGAQPSAQHGLVREDCLGKPLRLVGGGRHRGGAEGAVARGEVGGGSAEVRPKRFGRDAGAKEILFRGELGEKRGDAQTTD